MSHALITVFMSESDTLADLLAPYDENRSLPEPVEQPCYLLRFGDDDHNEHCCGGSLTIVSDDNPRGKWDYWRPLAEQQQDWDAERWRTAAQKSPGEFVTFAILIPGEGWHDRSDDPRYWQRTDDEAEWESRFMAVAERALALGLTPVVCDYHS